MLMGTQGAPTLICARVNQQTSEETDALHSDPTILARKGRIYVLSSGDADPAVIATVYERYYSDRSFDVLPSLQRALVAAYAVSPEGERSIPLVLVLQELTLFAVGSRFGSLWLVRSGGAKELLPKSLECRVLPPIDTDGGRDRESPTLYALYRRLSLGDTLVVTTQVAGNAPLDPALRQLAGLASSPDRLAHSLARQGFGDRSEKPPIMAIHIPGFSPVPDLGTTRSRSIGSMNRPMPRRMSIGSPVWIASLVAAAAIVLALWIRGPELREWDVSSLLTGMLIPAPTETTVRERSVSTFVVPTPRPTAIAPVVQLPETPRATPIPADRALVADLEGYSDHE